MKRAHILGVASLILCATVAGGIALSRPSFPARGSVQGAAAHPVRAFDAFDRHTHVTTELQLGSDPGHTLRLSTSFAGERRTDRARPEELVGFACQENTREAVIAMHRDSVEAMADGKPVQIHRSAGGSSEVLVRDLLRMARASEVELRLNGGKVVHLTPAQRAALLEFAAELGPE